MYKLIALDIDGTLLNSSNQVTDSVKKAIKFACEQGYDTAEIKFADRELYKKGVQKYVNEEKIFPILAQLKLQGYKIESGISLYYTENEDINTLTIDLKSSDD